MQGDKNSVLGSQPPEKIGAAKLRKPDRVAAGMRAVTERLKFTFRESGFARSLRDRFKINKKDGFGCQSCAWPSPDVDPHVFEFCENGIKAG